MQQRGGPAAVSGETREAGLVEPVPPPDHVEVHDAEGQDRWLRDHHAWLADFAERMAEEADAFAAMLEEAARRGDAERRLAVAAVEREVAGIARRNAARLRDQPAGHHLDLERLPSLPPLARPGSQPGSGQQPDEVELPAPTVRQATALAAGGPGSFRRSTSGQ